jgi:guanylate kinase
VDGEDYHFLHPEDFTTRLGNGEFLEHAEVHGNHYGTLKGPVLENLRNGIDVLLDIDTHGAANIRACGDPLILRALADVFLLPPDLEELHRRLLRRGTETEEQVEIRMRNAAKEMECWRDYRYTIINGSMEENIEKFRAVMRAERYLSHRMTAVETAPKSESAS